MSAAEAKAKATEGHGFNEANDFFSARIAFLEAYDCVFAISEFSEARWTTYKTTDREDAGSEDGSGRRLVSAGQAAEWAAEAAGGAAQKVGAMDAAAKEYAAECMLPRSGGFVAAD